MNVRPHHAGRRVTECLPSERDFQTMVVDVARLAGWRVAHFRPLRRQDGSWRTPTSYDAAGWPDLTLVRPPRLAFVELKSHRGQPTDRQLEWLDVLRLLPESRCTSGTPLTGTTRRDTHRPGPTGMSVTMTPLAGSGCSSVDAPDRGGELDEIVAGIPVEPPLVHCRGRLWLDARQPARATSRQRSVAPMHPCVPGRTTRTRRRSRRTRRASVLLRPGRLSPGRVPGIAPLQPRPTAGMPRRRRTSPAAVAPTAVAGCSSPTSPTIRSTFSVSPLCSWRRY